MASKSVSSRGVEVNRLRLRVIYVPVSKQSFPILLIKLLNIKCEIKDKMNDLYFDDSLDSNSGTSDSIIGDRTVDEGEVTEI